MLQLALLAINSFKCYRVLCVGQTYLLKVQPSMKDIKTPERNNLFAAGQIATSNVRDLLLATNARFVEHLLS